MSLALALGLHKAGYITLPQIEEAMNAHIVYGGTLLSKLVELGFIADHHLAAYLSAEYNLPLADAEDFASVSPEALSAVDMELACDKKVFPLRKNGNYLYLAIFDPTKEEDLAQIKEQTGLKIVPVIATDSQIQQAIQHFYVNETIRNLCENEVVGSDVADNEAASDSSSFEDLNELSFGDELGPLDSGDDSDFSAPKEAEPAFTYASFEFSQEDGNTFSMDAALRHAAIMTSELQATPESNSIIEHSESTPPAAAPAEAEVSTPAPAPLPVANDYVEPLAANPEAAPVAATEVAPTEAANVAAQAETIADSADVKELSAFEKLALATSRDDIAAITLEYAHVTWPRVLLLVEKQNYLKVWAAVGEGMESNPNLNTMKIPLHQSSQFRKVFNHAQPFLGSLSATSRFYDSFFKRLGGPIRPLRTFILPIYIGKRVIGLFYADSADKVPPSGDMSNFYQLIDAIASAFEKIISQRHLQIKNQQ